MAMAVVFLVVSLLAAPAVYATDHTVGDSSGWTQNVNYDNWAKGKTFTVGDNLVFKYTSTHSVDEVDQSDYTSCITGNSLAQYKSGSDTIPLTKAGPMFFICPTFGHCAGGMKLSITVSAASTPSPPGSTPPSTPGTPPSSGMPPSKESPPPPKNGAAGSNMSQMVIGICIVLASVFAFMG